MARLRVLALRGEPRARRKPLPDARARAALPHHGRQPRRQARLPCLDRLQPGEEKYLE